MSYANENETIRTNFNEKTITSNLTTTVIGHPIIFKEKTRSTQIIAHDLAKSGANHGTVVIAREQTEARGRLNRPWHSVKNKAISMSLILRPNISPNIAPQLTLFTATVLADAIKEITNIDIQIKWPNDLLINGRKFVGILTEMHAKKEIVDYIVMGIGINVNYHLGDLPENTKYPTTSLFIETAKKWDLSSLIQNILKHFEENFPTFLEEGFAAFKYQWESYSYKLGEKLFINDFNKKWYGVFKGISEDGGLLIQNEQNEIVKIYSAEIEWYN